MPWGRAGGVGLVSTGGSPLDEWSKGGGQARVLPHIPPNLGPRLPGPEAAMPQSSEHQRRQVPSLRSAPQVCPAGFLPQVSPVRVDMKSQACCREPRTSFAQGRVSASPKARPPTAKNGSSRIQRH